MLVSFGKAALSPVPGSSTGTTLNLSRMTYRGLRCCLSRLSGGQGPVAKPRGSSLAGNKSWRSEQPQGFGLSDERGAGSVRARVV
eukprot:762707-Alexandrium_andersonii.AAC.1